MIPQSISQRKNLPYRTNSNKFQRKSTLLLNRGTSSKSKEKKKNLDYGYFLKRVHSRNKSTNPQQESFQKNLSNEISTKIQSSSIDHCKRKNSPIFTSNRQNEEKIRLLHQHEKRNQAYFESLYLHERDMHLKYQREYEKVCHQLNQSQANCQYLKSQVNRLLDDKINKEERVQSLEKIILQNEINLSMTNLEKLRQSIKVNRFIEVNNDNKNLRKLLQQVSLTKNELLQQNIRMKNEISSLSTKRLKIQQQNSLLFIKKPEKNVQNHLSNLEFFLENRLREIEIELFNEKEKVKMLKVKVHALELQKNDEANEFQKKKQSQIRALKKTYEQKISNMKQKMGENCSNIFRNKTKRSDSEFFTLELSPQP